MKFSESDANGDVKSGKCTITFYESGTEDQNMELYRSDNANYQFFRFSVNPTSIPAGYDPDVPGQENLDYFIIAKVVATEDRQEDQDTKRFPFTDNNLHISEITLCQAGGMRSDTGSLFNDGGPQNSGEVTYPQGCLEFFPSQPLNSDDLVALFGE